MGVVYCLQPFAFPKEIAHSDMSIIGTHERIVNLLHCDRCALKLPLVYHAPPSSVDLTADLQVRWNERQRKPFNQLPELCHLFIAGVGGVHAEPTDTYTRELVSYPTLSAGRHFIRRLPGSIYSSLVPSPLPAAILSRAPSTSRRPEVGWGRAAVSRWKLRFTSKLGMGISGTFLP